MLFSVTGMSCIMVNTHANEWSEKWPQLPYRLTNREWKWFFFLFENNEISDSDIWQSIFSTVFPISCAYAYLNSRWRYWWPSSINIFVLNINKSKNTYEYISIKSQTTENSSKRIRSRRQEKKKKGFFFRKDVSTEQESKGIG